jgi:protein TonB
VNQGVLKPAHRVDPIYPEAARQLGIYGTFTLKAIIGTDGRVNDLQVLTGDQVLAPAAVAAVPQWTYKPLTANGVPVEIETQIDVRFSRQ